MFRQRIAILVAILVLIVASFEAGQWAHDMYRDDSGIYYTQAMLAFGHYTSYGRIKYSLEHKCYDAALTDAKELQNLQIRLISDSLRATNNNPELLEYIRLRNPELLKAILAGDIPKQRSYTTTCP